MLDEADLRRLAEIGVDVYLPRGAGSSPVSAAAFAPTSVAGLPAGAIAVALLADASAPRAAALLAAVTRALAFARVSCRQADAADEGMLSDVRALVAIGVARARGGRAAARAAPA